MALAALKRTTWTLVSSQATVVGVGDGALTLAFPTPGLREQFAGRSDHAEYVRQSLIDVLGVDWRIEAVVGGGPAAQGSPSPPARAPQGRPAAAPASRPAPAPRPTPAPRPAAGVPSSPPVGVVPPEQDVPEADDPDLDDSGLTGIALLERDLGARVIGEYDSA